MRVKELKVRRKFHRVLTGDAGNNSVQHTIRYPVCYTCWHTYKHTFTPVTIGFTHSSPDRVNDKVAVRG